MNARADTAHAGRKGLKARFPTVKRAGHESRCCLGHAEIWLLAVSKLDRSRPAQALSLVVVIDEADVATGKCQLSMRGVLEAEWALVGLERAAEAARMSAVCVDKFPSAGSVETHLTSGTHGVGVDDGAAARSGPERCHFRRPQSRLEQA